MPAPWMATADPLPGEIPDGYGARWSGAAWVVEAIPAVPSNEPSLTKLKADKLQELSWACEVQIVAGFKSAALGDQYHYPAKLSDQVNLSASVLDSIVPGLPENWTTPFWCAVDPEVPETWAYRPHTAQQIQGVGRDGKASNLQALGRKATLDAQVAAATSPAELAAITWEDDLLD